MKDVFTEEEIERYARHIILPEVGGVGQQKLKAARVLIIGVGGLGAPVIAYLAAAGIGTIGLVDDDEVSLSNLQRQIIHDTSFLGQRKTTSAKAAIKKLNPYILVEEYPVRLEQFLKSGSRFEIKNCDKNKRLEQSVEDPSETKTAPGSSNADRILATYDIIVDGSDNAATRYLVADVAAKLQKPLVSGAIGRFDGSLTVLMPYQDNNPSYRDLFPSISEANDISPCAQVGVIGALPGVIGSLQAMEVIKLVCGIGRPLIGRLLIYDALNAHFDIIHYGAGVDHLSR